MMRLGFSVGMMLVIGAGCLRDVDRANVNARVPPAEADRVELESALGPTGKRKPDARRPAEKLVLYSNGAALVVFPQVGPRHGNEQCAIQVFLPCNANEVQKLAAAISALRPLFLTPDLHDRLAPRARYHCKGSAGDLPLSVGLLEGRDLLLEGIYKEFFACAHYELARAIAWARCAEDLLLAGDASAALAMYKEAFTGIGDWDNQASLKAGKNGRIVESFLGTRLAYALIAGSADNEVDAHLYKRVWEKVTRDIFRITWEKNSATASFLPSWAQLLNVQATLSPPRCKGTFAP